MISLEPKDLMREIGLARDWLKPTLEKIAEVSRRLAGEHYKNTKQDDASSGVAGPVTPENYPFSYKLFVKPQLLYGSPTCTIQATRRAEDQATGDALEMAVNGWVKETDAESTLDQVIDDAFVGFGITKAGVEPRGDYFGGGLQAVEGDFEQDPNYPFLVRVPPKHFFAERAYTLSKSRIVGQVFERDLEDVQQDERYDQTARAALQQRPEMDDASLEAYPDEARKYMRETLRKKINLYECYLPEHGLIITLAEQGPDNATVLRQEPYFGPDEGPYTLWGLTSVPNEMLPLSPIVALWDEFLELQEHSMDMADSARSHKSIGVAQKGDAEDAKVVKDARNGGLYLLGNPGAVQKLEIGGTTAAQMQFTQYLRERLDRNMGYGDAQRGVVTSGTATEASLANSSSDLRVSEMGKQVRKGVKSSFRKIAWYFENDASIGRMEMMKEDPVTGQMIPGQFIAGPWQGGYVKNAFIPPQPQSNFDTDFLFDIEIDIGKQDDAIRQKRAQDELQLVAVTLAPLVGPQNINWRRVVDRYGSAYNQKNLSRIIFIDQMGMMLPLDPLTGMPAKQPIMPPSQQQASPGAGMTALPGLMANAGTGMGGALRATGNGGGNSPAQAQTAQGAVS